LHVWLLHLARQRHMPKTVENTANHDSSSACMVTVVTVKLQDVDDG
jgi:hypothetical protein